MVPETISYSKISPNRHFKTAETVVIQHFRKTHLHRSG